MTVLFLVVISIVFFWLSSVVRRAEREQALLARRYLEFADSLRAEMNVEISQLVQEMVRLRETIEAEQRRRQHGAAG